MFRLTETQLGMFLEWEANHDSLQYNVSFYMRLSTAIDLARLETAVRETVAAHPVFRTRFVVRDGTVLQDFESKAEIPFVRQSFEDEAAALAAAGSFTHPFDLLNGEIARFAFFDSPTANYFVVDFSHVVVDGTTTSLFFREIAQRYDGKAVAGEGASYAEFAAAEEASFSSAAYAEAAADLKARLSGVSATQPENPWPAERVPGLLQTTHAFIDKGEVDACCQALGTTPNLFFMGVFARTLGGFANEKRVLFYTINHGRRDKTFRRTYGACIKMVPVLGELKGEASLKDHIAGFHLHRAGVYPFTHAVRDLGLKPGFLFVFQDGTTELDMSFGGEKCRLVLASAGGASELPTAQVFVVEKNGKLCYECSLSCFSGTYSQRFIEEFAAVFASTAKNFAAYADRPLGDIPLLGAATSADVLALSRGEDLPYDDTKTLVDLVEARVKESPGHVALVDCETSVTYGELSARSAALAAKLAESGVKPGAFVGLMLPRRVSFVIAALAVQKCGAGYVPIDPEYPADRIAYMLADSEAPVLITTQDLLAGKSLAYGGTILEPSAPVTSVPATPASVTSAPATPSPHDPAYMIYTSGSTGKPKGVVVPHRALRHLCAWTKDVFGLTSGSRTATHPSFSFDASVIDIFPTLAAGAELHIFAEEIRKDLPAMREYIVAHGITGVTMSTQIGMALIDTYPDLPLRYIQVGGEKLLPTAKTAIRIVNGYGPTEFCVSSSYQVVDQSAIGDIPIGRAVPGTSSFVVDRYGHLLPQGFAGEIALAGPQLADGYWHNPEKTAAAFTPIPFDLPATAAPGTPRFYRTGDLARYNAKGRLEYLGRIDFQVKLRGFRIEIGEVEHAAASFAGVGAVAAEVRAVDGTPHLVLYYVAESAVDEGALKASMAATLTAYMVPDYFVRLDAMPMTPNGKINRKVLPVPRASGAEEPFVEPRAGAETEIAAAYAETLGLARFSAAADFFRSGGTSLLGIKAVVALQKRGLDVQYGDLFKYKTPQALAAFLTGAAQPATSDRQPPAFDYGAYDYAAIDAFLSATRTELFDGFKVHSLGDVLLTGATGYLGIHVLRYLLERTSSSVAVLIRAKHGTGPERRLDADYVYYFGTRLARALRDRVTFVEGDITDSDLAERLAGVSVNTVINCAALVKHYVADDAMDRINVGGVENLISYCEKTGARFVQTSTYSVGGAVGAASPATLSERTLFVGQESDNDYVRTKFLAERAVLAATAAGRLRGKVMRLGNLMGRETDGEFQMNVGANAFVNSLKSYKAIGAFPLEELSSRIEMSPIDRVAEAICLLATTPDDMAVFHPFNTYALDLGAVLGAMARRGYEIDWVSRGEFAARVEALRNDPTHADELQGILHYAQRHLDEKKMTPVVNSWTTTVLYRLGFRWKLAEDRYLSNFLEMLDGLAVFNR